MSLHPKKLWQFLFHDFHIPAYTLVGCMLEAQIFINIMESKLSQFFWMKGHIIRGLKPVLRSFGPNWEFAPGYFDFRYFKCFYRFEDNNGVSLSKIAVQSRLSKSPLDVKPRLKPTKQVLHTEVLHKCLWFYIHMLNVFALHIHVNKREDCSRSYK